MLKTLAGLQLTEYAYLVAAGLFILSLYWMNHPQTARRSVLALRPDEQPRPGGLELALRQLADRSTVPGRIISSFHGGVATGLLPEHEHALHGWIMFFGDVLSVDEATDRLRTG